MEWNKPIFCFITLEIDYLMLMFIQMLVQKLDLGQSNGFQLIWQIIKINILKNKNKKQIEQPRQKLALQTHLLEVGGAHVVKRLGRHSMMSQDGQVVLSGQFAQQVHQLLLHTRFLQRDYSFRWDATLCFQMLQMFICAM